MRIVLLALAACIAAQAAVASHLIELQAPSTPKPDYHQYASVARWLVHQNSWGVLSTISRHLGGAPYGHSVSYSDGPLGRSTGRLLLYLTTMDAAAQDLQADSRATLTLCEAQLAGACSGTDPEDPTCAKISISGRLTPVKKGQLAEAEDLLFTRHPAMRDWPADHGFRVYELHIATMALLDYYGGAHVVSPEDYWAADPSGRQRQGEGGGAALGQGSTAAAAAAAAA